MRIVFFGTPDEGGSALRALADSHHEVALVVTQPDRRRGRGGDTMPSPVKRVAEELGLPVRTPHRAVEVVDELRASGAELGVVVAFGQLLPNEVIESFPHGLVNIHFSLLPRWRGAAPVERAILAGDAETGVCLMEIAEELDAGGIYAVERIPIPEEASAGEVRDRLAEVGARLLVKRLDDVPGTEPTSQEGEPTYAKKLSPEEFELDWSRPAAELVRVVRAGNPSPGAWTQADGRRLKVLRARVGTRPPGPSGSLGDDCVVATGDGGVLLEEVQPEGKPAMAADAWRRGAGRDVERLGA